MPDYIAFIEYTILSIGQLIIAINRLILPGISRERVRIPISINGHVRSIVLIDVLHILQIKGNLISVARL